MHCNAHKCFTGIARSSSMSSRLSSRLALRAFATTVGPAGKLPPEVEKMMKTLGIKLPPGAKVEVRDMRGMDFADLPEELKAEIKSAATERRTPSKEDEAESLPTVIAMPAPENDSAASTAISDVSGSRKKKTGRKSRQDGASKSSPTNIMELLAGKGVKSFVLGGPANADGEQDEETTSSPGLQQREWYQQQLQGTSSENPIDVNYFDWSSPLDTRCATVPLLTEARSANIEIPWPRDAALPSQMHIDWNDEGVPTHVRVACETDASVASSLDVPWGDGATVRVDYCQGDSLLKDSEPGAVPSTFTSAIGNFFSPKGAILRQRALDDDQEINCNVCGGDSRKIGGPIYTADEEDDFHVCRECIGHAHVMRKNGYDALAGVDVDASTHCNRLLGGPAGNTSQIDDGEDSDSTPNPLAMMGAPPSRSFKVEKHVTVRFADVIGQEIAVEKLKEFAEILQYPDSYDVIGSKVPKGGLLTGPPGTGKTLLAQAVAGECQLPFISVQGSEFNESLVGSGPRNVRKLFKTARKQAALHGGCIVFIDEIDSIGRSRNNTDNSSASQGYCDTLNQLLAEIDGFHSKTDQIVLLAATNRAQVLDQALLRAGRFDRVVPVERPNVKEREALFWHYLQKLTWREGSIVQAGDASFISSTCAEVAPAQGKNLLSFNFQSHSSNRVFVDRFNKLVGTFVKSRVDMCLERTQDMGDKFKFSAHNRSILKVGSKFYVSNAADVANVTDGTIEEVGQIAKTAAKMTTGYTGATISGICNEAGIMAVREKIQEGDNKNRLIVTSAGARHIAKAIDFVAVGSEKKNFQIRPEEKASVAFHESGHAVLAYFLEHTPKPVKVTIVPRDSGSLGFMMPGEPQSEVRRTKSQIEAEICVLMGGRIAEEIFCDDIAAGARTDIEQATELAREYVSVYGMGIGNMFVNTTDERRLSEASKAKRDESIFVLINSCYETAKQLLVANKVKLEMLQKALLEHETLLADDIDAILK